MINTEIYEFQSRNINDCFEGCLNAVNKLIKDKHLRREDLIEYRTEDFVEHHSDDYVADWYYYKIFWRFLFVLFL